MIIQTETRARNERSLGKKTEEKNETKSRRIRSKLCKNSVRFSKEDSRAAPRNYKNQWDLLSSFWRRSPKTAKLIRDSAWTKKGRALLTRWRDRDRSISLSEHDRKRTRRARVGLLKKTCSRQLYLGVADDTDLDLPSPPSMNGDGNICNNDGRMNGGIQASFVRSYYGVEIFTVASSW